MAPKFVPDPEICMFSCRIPSYLHFNFQKVNLNQASQVAIASEKHTNVMYFPLESLVLINTRFHPIRGNTEISFLYLSYMFQKIVTLIRYRSTFARAYDTSLTPLQFTTDHGDYALSALFLMVLWLTNQNMVYISRGIFYASAICWKPMVWECIFASTETETCPWSG